MIIPIWSQQTLAEVLGALLGFSFGLAADKGFNSALGASFNPKSPLGKWALSVIQQGWHHFFIGLALMYFAAPYTSQNWALFLYCLGLGLVVSEAKLVAKLLAEFGASLQQLEVQQKQNQNQNTQGA